MNVQNLVVLTPLGKAKVVWTFPDGSFAVEYDFGGGQICSPYDPEIRVLDESKPARHAMYGRNLSVAM